VTDWPREIFIDLSLGRGDDQGRGRLADDSRELEIAMSTTPQPLGPATRKVLATIDDPELDARYPNRTHFVDAQNPDQALLASRALFSGDPVVVVHPDGREVLFTPESPSGVVAVLLLAALLWLKLRKRTASGELVQLPPRTQVEVRDAGGMPIAA